MIDLYSQLHSCSRKAISKRYKRFGHPYIYRPRGNLLVRLAAENNTTTDEIYRQLMELRKEILADEG